MTTSFPETKTGPRLGFASAAVAGCLAMVLFTGLPVCAQDASFMQEGFAAVQRRAPLFHDSFDILGMDERCPLPALQLLRRPPYVPEPCLIEEIEVAVRPGRVNQAGGRINKELKVRGLIPSGCAISIRGHGWYCMPCLALPEVSANPRAIGGKRHVDRGFERDGGGQPVKAE